jgi:hypothetical protein
MLESRSGCEEPGIDQNVLATCFASAYAPAVTVRRYACLAMINSAVSIEEIAAIVGIEPERSHRSASGGEPVTSY